MTTLPTTTPIRLPRPAGAAPLALPTTYGGQSAPAVTMTGSDAWRVIRTNLWWIILVVIASAFIGYGAERLFTAKLCQLYGGRVHAD